MGFWRVRQGAVCQRQRAFIRSHTHGALFDTVGQWCCWLTLSSSGGFARRQGRHRATARWKTLEQDGPMLELHTKWTRVYHIELNPTRGLNFGGFQHGEPPAREPGPCGRVYKDTFARTLSYRNLHQFIHAYIRHGLTRLPLTRSLGHMCTYASAHTLSLSLDLWSDSCILTLHKHVSPLPLLRRY